MLTDTPDVIYAYDGWAGFCRELAHPALKYRKTVL